MVLGCSSEATADEFQWMPVYSAMSVHVNPTWSTFLEPSTTASLMIISSFWDETPQKSIKSGSDSETSRWRSGYLVPHIRGFQVACSECESSTEN